MHQFVQTIMQGTLAGTSASNSLANTGAILQPKQLHREIQAEGILASWVIWVARAILAGQTILDQLRPWQAMGRHEFCSSQEITASQVTGVLQQAQTFQDQGRFNDAIDLCEQILESGFDRPDARYFLGWLYQEQQRWDEAIQQFQTSAQRS